MSESLSGGRGSSLALPLETFGSYTVPPGYKAVTIDRCRGCGRSVLWCLTRHDKMSPHDQDGTSHFATCTSAASFRRRRGAVR